MKYGWVMKRLKNQKGMSLTEVIIAGGLLIAVSVGVMKTTSNMQFSNDLFKIKSEEQLSFNHVSSILVDSESCKNTLSGKSVGDTFTQIMQKGGNLIKFGSAIDFVNNTRVKSLTVSSQDFSACSSYPCIGTIVLDVQYERKIKGKIQDGVKKQIQINVKKLAADTGIDSCFAATDGAVDTAKEETCLLLGGSYTESPSTCTFSGASLVNNLNTINNTNSNQQGQITTLQSQLSNALAQNESMKKELDSLKDRVSALEKSETSGSGAPGSGSGINSYPPPSCPPKQFSRTSADGSNTCTWSPGTATATTKKMVTGTNGGATLEFTCSPQAYTTVNGQKVYSSSSWAIWYQTSGGTSSDCPASL